MISNRWRGERISIAPDTPVAIIQSHLSRYIWAMHYCVGKDVLDLGCGTGYGTWMLGTVASDIIGIDKCVEAITEAKRDFNGVFFDLSIEDAPQQMSFRADTVVAFEVMEHLDDVDVGMEAIKQLLKPEGMALISIPLHQPSEWHHLRDYGYEDWREIVERHFEIVPNGVYWQPTEETIYWDGNVMIRKMPTEVPLTGISIFAVVKK